MAFVSQSDRKLVSLNKSLQNIGPGQYDTFDVYKIGNTVPSIAPFNSSTVKRTIYDQQKIKQTLSSIKVGPGSYNVDNSFIEKNIKTYVNDHSVIVKINSLETPQFKSAVPRFKSLQTQIPGPGFYPHDEKISTFHQQYRKRSTQKRKIMKEKLHQFITQLKKDHKISQKPSIPSKSYSLDKRTQSLKQNKDKSFSNITDQQNKSKNKKGFTWNKTQRKVFPQAKNNFTQRNLGPGKYFNKQKNDQNQKLTKLIPNNKFMKKRSKTQSSTFKTKYARTFFDQIYYQTNSKQTATIRHEQRFKTDKPGPGDYELDNGLSKKLKRSKNNVAYQFFGSTVDRFQPQKISNIESETKNGLFSFYDKQKSSRNSDNFSSLCQQKSFNKKDLGFLSTNEKKTQFIKDDDIPGPGQYEIPLAKSLFKPKKGKAVQNFGFSKERFPKQITQQIIIQDLINDQPNFSQKKKKVTQSFMFKSNVKKQAFNTKNDQSQTFGKYNINHTDLGTKMQKQAMFLQNLRKIDVQIPAFNSGNARFSYQKYSKSLQPQNVKQKSINKKQQNKRFLVDSGKRDVMRQKLISKNRQQVIKSKKSTIYNDQQGKDRFENLQMRQKYRNPGVGDYSLRSNWMKQSYNIKYQHNKNHVKTQHNLTTLQT